MDIQEACHYVTSRFRYVADVSGDHWKVMKGKRMIGDCEDFSLTVTHLVFGGWFGFIKAIISGRAKIHRVVTPTDENHAVGEIDGLWFDNWSFDAVDRETFFSSTGHRYKFRRNPLVVFLKLIGPWKYVVMGLMTWVFLMVVL